MTLNLLFQALGMSNIATLRDERKVYLIATSGFEYEIPFDVQLKMVEIALTELIGKTTWVVFDNCEEKRIEDNGRTCIFPLTLLDEDCTTKVYAILDNYGSVEALKESAGNSNINSQYTLTFLLPEEY